MNADDPPIKKRIIQAGQRSVPDYVNDTKVKFHYVTRTVGEEPSTIDDSRKHKQPMELIIGKKFKFEAWEECLKTMAECEISSFVVDRKLTATYPIVSKSLRDIFSGKEASSQTSHCCAMTAMNDSGLGYEDLNKLMAEPQTLEFILEVLSVEPPGSYNKDAWAMSSDEKVNKIPKLKEEGNFLYGNKNYTEASKKYSEALGLLERLIMLERPGSEEQKELETQKVPLLLNYAQCQLLLGSFYPVIEHTTEALKISPDNVKALFRRAKAECEVWRVEEARKDFERAAELDPSIASKVKLELKRLDEAVKKKDAEDRAKLQGKLFG